MPTNAFNRCCETGTNHIEPSRVERRTDTIHNPECTGTCSPSDDLNRETRFTAYDDAAVGSGSIVNQVQFEYNAFGQPVEDGQAHSGGVTP